MYLFVDQSGAIVAAFAGWDMAEEFAQGHHHAGYERREIATPVQQASELAMAKAAALDAFEQTREAKKEVSFWRGQCSQIGERLAQRDGVG